MKVAVVGNLANTGYYFARVLRRLGFGGDLFLSRDELAQPTSNPFWKDLALCHQRPNWIIGWNSGRWMDCMYASKELQRTKLPGLLAVLRLRLLLRRYDAILALGGGALYSQFAGRPFLAVALGSDLRELGRRESYPQPWRSFLMRRALRRARLVLLANCDQEMLARADEIGLKRVGYLPLVIDVHTYAPAFERLEGKEFVVFHPARHDWSSSCAPKRYSKGNDRLLRAFARFVSHHPDSRLVMLDRGVARESSKVLVKELGITGHIQWLDEMSSDELISHYRESQVVADQFCVGAMGGIALEAMSCGKPVLVYVNPETYARSYPEFPPLLNACTEDEIYSQLLQARDPGFRIRLGREARDWIVKYHSEEAVADRLNALFKEIVNRSGAIHDAPAKPLVTTGT